MNIESLHKSQDGQGARAFLQLTIEGRSFEWHSQYITGKEIRKLAGLSVEGELFLSISDPWKDDLILDDEIVDLARPGIEQFYIRRALQYQINGVGYESNSQYIRGTRIRRQGNIPAEQEIYLISEKGWDDELIEDNQWVNLARPGREKFVSKGVNIQVILIVNAKEKMWNNKSITFEEVVILQYGAIDPNPDVVYSVTYKNGPRENPEGIMTDGETLFVKNKMNFYVSRTNRS